MSNSYYWKVFKSIAKRIKTTQDLNDFYAYMDDLSESIITYETQEEYDLLKGVIRNEQED